MKIDFRMIFQFSWSVEVVAHQDPIPDVDAHGEEGGEVSGHQDLLVLKARRKAARKYQLGGKLDG